MGSDDAIVINAGPALQRWLRELAIFSIRGYTTGMSSQAGGC
jgi:hypothetical protein